jgi:hypothetical protein
MLTACGEKPPNLLRLHVFYKIQAAVNIHINPSIISLPIYMTDSEIGC